MSRSTTSGAALAERVLAGDPRAIARAISVIDDDERAAAGLIGQLFGRTGRAYVLGVTGPPGAGKSTLVDRLVTAFRQQEKKVGVLAVDPTSPFSGGALLGDRIRMQVHAGDTDVFIRSMATRGHLGGLSRATDDAALVLDAAGKDIIIVETVGVGQDEIEIVRTADMTILALVPGTGDDVQALKAGIMEIADVFVVNKADREGADRMVASIESTLALEGKLSRGSAPDIRAGVANSVRSVGRPDPGSVARGDPYAPLRSLASALRAPTAASWRSPVVKTQATTGEGIPELLAVVERFREASAPQQAERRRMRAATRLRDILMRQFARHLDEHVLGADERARIVDDITARLVNPYDAAAAIMKRALK